MHQASLLGLILAAALVAACGDSAGAPQTEGTSTTDDAGTSSSSGQPSDTESEGSSSSSSTGEPEPGDGFGPPEGIALEEVVVNQAVAVPVWSAADGFIDGDGRNAPLLRGRAGAVFARFSVEGGFEPREITARLHLGAETFETRMMVSESSTDDPHTWFAWLLEADEVVEGAEFQVELVEPVDEPSEQDPVTAPADGPAPLGFQGPDLGLDVVFMPITVEAENCNETREPLESELETAHEYLFQTLPLQTLDITVHERPATVQLEERGDGPAIIGAIAAARTTDEIPATTIVVGIPPDCAGPFDYGLLNGSGGEAQERSGIVIATPADWYTKRLGFLAAMMEGRLRVSCPKWAFDVPDPNFPYEDGLIGTWGFGVLDHQLRSPATHYSVVSNCFTSWISDYGWEIAYEQLKLLNGT